MNKQILALLVVAGMQAGVCGAYQNQAEVVADYIQKNDTPKAENKIALGNALLGAGCLSCLAFLGGTIITDPLLGFSARKDRHTSLVFFGLSVISLAIMASGREVISHGERLKYSVETLKKRMKNFSPEELEKRKDDITWEEYDKLARENAQLQNERLKQKLAKQEETA